MYPYPGVDSVRIDFLAESHDVKVRQVDASGVSYTLHGFTEALVFHTNASVDTIAYTEHIAQVLPLRVSADGNLSIGTFYSADDRAVILAHGGSLTAARGEYYQPADPNANYCTDFILHRHKQRMTPTRRMDLFAVLESG